MYYNELVYLVLGQSSNQRGWWFSRDDEDYFKANDSTDCARGFEQSLKIVEEICLAQVRKYGIFSFSEPHQNSDCMGSVPHDL